MKVTSAQFVRSVVDLANIPRQRLPAIAFAGRSNVGKSSMINCLVTRKHLAKTSGTPGKTRQINFFMINAQFYFVDLPGFGYAKVSRAMRNQWQTLIEPFLAEAEFLKGVVQIVDIRHDLFEMDVQLFQWLRYHDIPIILTAIKADKISRGQADARVRSYRKALGFEDGIVIAFSSKTGTGKKELWKRIETLLRAS
jgi:GTP-binding protein